MANFLNAVTLAQQPPPIDPLNGTDVEFTRLKSIIIKEPAVTNWRIFIMRAVLTIVAVVILSHFFYPDAPVIFFVLLGILLVGLAYLKEYLGQRKKTR